MDMPDNVETIGQHQYKCVSLPQDKWETLAELMGDILGAPITTLVNGFGVKDLEGLFDGSTGAMGLMFASFSRKMTAENLRALRTAMGDSLWVMGQDEQGNAGWTLLDAKQQNLWWGANRSEFVPVAWLFLRWQFEDFFRGFGGLVSLKLPSAPSQSKSTNAPGEPSHGT